VNDHATARGEADVVNHDVFISYSEPDKPKADAVCSLLERREIRCWVAPRDILPGATWGSSIIRAIQQSKVFVLVFSSHSNHSPQVVREVERAVRHAIPIIPFRIEAATPTGDMEYFISAQHWLDALDPPLERHIERLASVVKKLLAEDLEPESPREGKTAGAVKTTAGAKAGEEQLKAAIEEVKAAEETKAAGAPAQLPPRVDRPTAPSEIVRAWRPLSHSPAKPLVIAGGIIGGFLILAILVVIIIALIPNDEDDPIITPPSFDEPPVTSGPQVIQGTLDTTDLVRDDGSYYDEHTVTTPAGSRLVVTLESTDFDTYLNIFAPDTFFFDDDAGGGTNSRIVIPTTDAATYRIWANTLRKGDTGNYTLTIQRFP
jgi:hypothetical protein